ncbi:MAG: pirin family protein, partial [Gammaproteobacteria bacterium]
MDNSGSVKSVSRILRTVDSHWVGDGFPVRTLFFYGEYGAELSPFLMLDYAGPREFPPTDARLGVGAHPHRGFETVTIVYAGEVEHRDSSGGGGHIGPGDVQWMTAASGLVHEEFHGREYARRGGMFEMVQLWVNLPAKDKMAPPRYQAITSEQIPVVDLPDDAGTARVIAGELDGNKGPAMTFSPVHVRDLRLSSERQFNIAVPEGYTTALVVLRGTLVLSEAHSLGAAEVGLFERQGNVIKIDKADEVTALLLCGEPINEPIAGHGPFVMNTPEEIRQAIVDYQSGRL